MGVITCDIRSLALAHRHDPTLSDLLLLHVHTDMMLRCQIFSWLWAGVEGGGWVGCNKVRWLLHTDFMLRCGPLPLCSSSNMTMNFLKLQNILVLDLPGLPYATAFQVDFKQKGVASEHI